MLETRHLLKSAFLDNERNLWLIAPQDPGQPAHLAVFLDAERYRGRVGAVSAIRELTAGRALANTLFVFVSEQSPEARWRECPCHPPFARFINEELLPWLEALHPEIGPDSERVLIGLSYTGLAASHAAYSPYARWTKVISQSGSHWSDDCWLTGQYWSLAAPRAVAFYLDIGLQETAENVRHREDLVQVVSQIDAVRRFRDVLRATGHTVTYVEFDGGHEYAAWGRTLPGALRWALPKDRAFDSVVAGERTNT